MCGIAGYIGKRVIDDDSIQNATRSISHRGPDGEGIYKSGNVALIHRRLAILDLEQRSDQPFRIRDKVLIFNGEIYNYLEIRQELISRGHSFITTGDTEVLAHALLEWGERALDRLEGMWAFAWYDETDQSLMLSRDRFGEKPLYIWETDDGLYFGSEIKAIAALAGKWPEKNTTHLIRYMINGYKSLNKVGDLFFKDIEKLSHASCLHLSANGNKRVQKYWDPKPQQNNSMSYKDAVDLTKQHLITSVDLRMRSDVPLAFCMSGGIDSNALISIARRIFDYDVHGFTIMNTDARYEEKDLVDLVVSELGIKHTPIELSSQNFLSELENLVRFHDGPVATISYYVHAQLMQSIAEQGYKVAIMGTAADELFTGYYDHHNLYLYEMRDNEDLYTEALENWQKYQSSIVRNPFLKNPNLFIDDQKFRDHIYLNREEFSSWLLEDWREDFTEVDFEQPLLRNRMLNELFYEVVPVVLNEDDLNAMHYSIENRSPFLDRKLFDHAFSIPTRHLVQNGRAKSVLREAMRGIVPDEILDNRRKVGFNAPILELVDMNDKETRDYILDDSPIFDLMNKSQIESLISNKELQNSMSKFLFYFLNAKIFLEQKNNI